VRNRWPENQWGQYEARLAAWNVEPQPAATEPIEQRPAHPVYDDYNVVACPECGKSFLPDCLERHLLRSHGRGEPEPLTPEPLVGERRTRAQRAKRARLPGGKRTRAQLPREVKAAVWKRDGGKCRKCGISDSASVLKNGEHLHYDHIRAWSKNGSDTVNNIQLLCGQCNRKKADR
jgi:5-methylcytosine-specific restriction endonuclease McrA